MEHYVKAACAAEGLEPLAIARILRRMSDAGWAPERLKRKAPKVKARASKKRSAKPKTQATLRHVSHWYRPPYPRPWPMFAETPAEYWAGHADGALCALGSRVYTPQASKRAKAAYDVGWATGRAQDCAWTAENDAKIRAGKQ